MSEPRCPDPACRAVLQMYWEIFAHTPAPCRYLAEQLAAVTGMEARNRQRQAQVRLLGTGLQVTHAGR